MSDELIEYLASDYREATGNRAYTTIREGDAWIEGWMSEIYAWTLENRSELEELG